MTKVISTINLKGGVGKTTTTVAIADFLSSDHGKRVLVIDLDPQTNATVMMIGEEKWRKLNNKHYTIAQLFKDAVDREKKFDFSSTLQKNVSDVRGADTVDLLPSSIDLISIQDRLATIPSGEFYSTTPIDLLKRSITSMSNLDNYDIVLIDCPPNLGLITLNGLRMSDGFIIPTIPDILSTYGIPQIVTRVSKFSDEIGETIQPLGIIITKYQENSRVHRNTAKHLRTKSNPPVFDTPIPQANDIAAAAEHESESRTARQKWGYRGLGDSLRDLTSEVLEKLED